MIETNILEENQNNPRKSDYFKHGSSYYRRSVGLFNWLKMSKPKEKDAEKKSPRCKLYERDIR